MSDPPHDRLEPPADGAGAAAPQPPPIPGTSPPTHASYLPRADAPRAHGASRAELDPRPTVVLGVSGSIAAFKTVELARLLLKAGIRVIPTMTTSARHFLGAATLSALCEHRVHTEMFEPDAAGEVHVDLTSQADVIALAPATAELLASLAQGRAQDVVRAVALCARCPIVVAPAMHPRMWEHPATQRNVATILADGRAELVGPVYGEVASGEQGMGRLADPEAIAAAIIGHCGARDLSGLHVVITAGPTVEDLDPARFLSNRSSGKMGFAVAERAAARGAEVTLIAGPVALPTPHRVNRRDVRDAQSMRAALWETLGDDLSQAHALIMAAAVADYRPAAPQSSKMKRTGDALGVRLELVPNPDLIQEIGSSRQGVRPFLVGFALETLRGDELVAEARRKLSAKGVDLVVANHADEAFEGDTNRATLVTGAAATELEQMPKLRLADRILDRVATACR